MLAQYAQSPGFDRHHWIDKLDMVALACNPSTQKLEAGGSTARIHPWPHSEFETSLDYMRPWCSPHPLQNCMHICVLLACIVPTMFTSGPHKETRRQGIRSSEDMDGGHCEPPRGGWDPTEAAALLTAEGLSVCPHGLCLRCRSQLSTRHFLL